MSESGASVRVKERLSKSDSQRVSARKRGSESECQRVSESVRECQRVSESECQRVSESGCLRASVRERVSERVRMTYRGTRLETRGWKSCGRLSNEWGRILCLQRLKTSVGSLVRALAARSLFVVCGD